jgi:hypothetical protein
MCPPGNASWSLPLVCVDLPSSLSSAETCEIRRLRKVAYDRQAIYNLAMGAQTLGFAVQAEDRPLLDELVAYFGDGNRSAYLRATLKVMKSIMIASQLRESQAYGQQRTAELGIEPTEIPALVQEFLKGNRQGKGK